MVKASAPIAGLVDRVTARYEELADPKKASEMSAYMRNLFPFFGIPAPVRRGVDREVTEGIEPLDDDALSSLCSALWERDEREFQYFAMERASAWVSNCTPRLIPSLEAMITTKSWWDTVDHLASRVMGPLVMASPQLTRTTDAWIESPNIWLARTALLYQLRYKSSTDADRLFRYCEVQAANPDFFIRKAIGWALREYSKTEPDLVGRWLAEKKPILSRLSFREGSKYAEVPE